MPNFCFQAERHHYRWWKSKPSPEEADGKEVYETKGHHWTTNPNTPRPDMPIKPIGRKDTRRGDSTGQRSVAYYADRIMKTCGGRIMTDECARIIRPSAVFSAAPLTAN